VASFKLTLNTVQPDGKACSTIFERLRYDPESDTSIVLARPVTGRTHQIRVHLQWLGYPITNDPLYHNTDIWGAQNGQGGITLEAEEELVKKLLAQTEAEDELDHALATSSLNNSEASANGNNSEQHQKAEFCSICQLPSRADPEPEKRIMYLHAWKYQAKDWAFETELPDWARETVLACTAASSPDQGTNTMVPESSIESSQ
jgi:tRNA pseudouridine synthase 9